MLESYIAPTAMTLFATTKAAKRGEQVMRDSAGANQAPAPTTPMLRSTRDRHAGERRHCIRARYREAVPRLAMAAESEPRNDLAIPSCDPRHSGAHPVT